MFFTEKSDIHQHTTAKTYDTKLSALEIKQNVIITSSYTGIQKTYRHTGICICIYYKNNYIYLSYRYLILKRKIGV